MVVKLDLDAYSRKDLRALTGTETLPPKGCIRKKLQIEKTPEPSRALKREAAERSAAATS